jgi:ribosomal protein L11 methyltransferase
VLGALTVRPPWEPAASTPIDVVIDPAQAFGTGAHATTRLCIELLLSGSVPAGGSLLDLGCGSGVLAIVAARLGFSPVLALDHDPLSVEATCSNAERNRVNVEATRVDLRSGSLPPADTVVANLLAPLLLEWAARLAGGQAAPPRRAIVSGLLSTEADAVSEAFAARGLCLEESKRVSRAGWTALLLERRGWTAAAVGV